ncbi:tyrosine-protein phosphatase non-receptor type 9 [Phymastichus coffea]|uniref:tyrosine-protein phosphatase non-receptor type 9 n=1 Tax=Phymastichus coffea TaxID=108790 RepID=UPI00273B08BD|nr:tyrosine-protein phosphatase non-receptor type 9 [Phymastichus coffea]XP_058809414.1 tyrosine-protein phosphatase non-receptor type 9 [Phymastichus coffea]XP_058809415.1 tyrosine-protein phosphatase non-receptor type 9 [Phymastichus coffea]XP_058809416.1 tyrosine-protein phosphatase non-receptor type 9 [Phymastichus coffea]
MAAVLTAEQEQATKEFIEVVNKYRAGRCVGPISWNAALKFLTARKFEVTRALALYEQHEATRRREGLALMQPTQEPLLSELRTGKFTVLPTRDSTGAAIAIFTAHLHLPQYTTHQTTLQGVVYQLDAALESKETQKHGLVFIYDMSDSKYQNFDYDLSQKILTLLKGGYPAKLKKVLIVTAPLWFKAPFKILRLFVREKLRERVFTVSIPQLTQHIPRDSLPQRLGGGLEVQHEAWLLHCLKSMTNRSGAAELCEVAAPAAAQLLHGLQAAAGPGESAPPAALANGRCEAAAGSSAGSPVSPLPEVAAGAQQPQPQPQPQPQRRPAETELPSGVEEAASPLQPPSSASSGFSDDDSLHGDLGLQAVGIEQLIEAIHARGRAGLVAEYMEIKQRPPDGTFTNAKLKTNLPKNRYTDVLCYDHSRVCLSQLDSEATSDYINANFVDGYKQKNAFISTQGPLPKTCADFWRMVWEQQTLVIVMTTRVVERGRTKCAQYWAAEPGDHVTSGNFTVTSLEVDTHPDYTITKLLLTNNKTEETREVCHMLYTGWPDYGVPQSARALLQFLSLVRQQQNTLLTNSGDTWAGHPRGPPIVVHCSAGIGRTGTFCTLDICISRLEDTGTVDIRGTVERIRAQRAFSIQMPDQYVFCHRALAEYALSRGMLSPQHLAMLPPTIEEDSD